MKSSQLLAILLIALLAPVAVFAQDGGEVEEEWSFAEDENWMPGRSSIILRFGGFHTESKKQVRDDADYYDYEPYGYTNIGGGVEYNYALNKFINLTAGAEIYYKKVRTEFWAESDAGDRVNRQDLEFTLIPLTVGVKLFPLGNSWDGDRERTVLPWIGGGIGAYIISEAEHSEYEYWDDYWEEWVPEWSEFHNDAGFGAYLSGGIQYKFSEKFSTGLEVRYTWAEATPYIEYYSDDPLEVGGMNVYFTFGIGL